MWNFLPWMYAAILCFSAAYLSENRFTRHLLAVVGVLLIAYLIGTRPETAGKDTVYYSTWFKEFFLKGNTDLVLYFERDYLFWGLAYIFSKISLSSNDILYLITLTCIAISYIAYSSFGRLGYLSYILFLSTFTFYSVYGNVIRQGLALSFFLCAVAFYCKGSYKLSLLSCVLAYLSHSSGIFSVLIFMERIKLNRFVFYIIAGMLVFISATLINSFISIFQASQLSAILESYSEKTSLMISLTRFAFWSFIPIDIIGHHFITSGKNKNLYKLLNIYRLCFLLQCIFISIPDTFTRVSLMRFILEPLIICGIILCSIKKSKENFLVVVALSITYSTLIVNITSFIETFT